MRKRPPTFILAAGGTGGHMFPADALKDELIKRGYRVLLFTDARGIAFPDLFEGVETHLIESGTFSTGSFFGKLKTGWNLLKGSLKASWLLFKISPAGVVGFGGYPVVPTMAAARLWTIPYCLHEQNAVLGRANRLMAGKAKAIALSFAKTKKLKWSKRLSTKVTGNPVRGSIIELGNKPYPSQGKDYVIRLLVFGGSQGARVFSNVVPEALSMLPKAVRGRLQVTQQCRKEDIERVEASYRNSGIAAEVFDYIRDIPGRLQWSHLVISRAGATSLFEFAAAGRPSILVPLPGAMDDHQSANARVMEAAGGGWMMPETEFTSPQLAKLIQKLSLKPDALKKAGKAALSISHPCAVEKLADLVENMAIPSMARSRRKKSGPAKGSGKQNLKRVLA